MTARTDDADTGGTTSEPTRRSMLRTTFLAAVVGVPAAALASCTEPDGRVNGGTGSRARSGDGSTPSDRPPSSTPAPRAAPDPDGQTLATAIDTERRLLAVYAATVAEHPDLKTKLAAYVHRHEQHLAALQAAAHPAAAPADPVATAGPDPKAKVAVAASAAVAMSALVDAERATAAAHGAELRALKDAGHARLVASI
ncbi:MAG TPA: hypothetical protein VE287_00100, partial [Actinopolymorphaceae bacterium]|nr:hypothetical protein [Actinopolymorphaceae bacterium]